MSRVHGVVAGIVAGVLLALTGLAEVEPVKLPAARPGFPMVLVDRSHDWRFAHDDLSDRMLAPAGFDVVMSDASLTALGSLSPFAVVMVEQTSWPTELSTEETELLEKYVEAGGCLVLIAKPGMPSERFARKFGFRIANKGKGPLRATEALQAYGGQKDVPTRAVPFYLSKSTKQETLVEDARGNTVAACRQVGKGKVVVWPDDHAYWDFCAQRDKVTMEVASAPTTTALFKWLVNGKTGQTRGRLHRIRAENEVRKDSLIFRYSLPSAKAARKIIGDVPEVLKVVEQNNGMGPPMDPPFTINWLSAGGGGWASGKTAGVCVYGADPAYPVKVMGHELTHSTTGPWPWAFNEAWAVIVGTRAAEKLGYRASAKNELNRIMERLDKEDHDRDRLDMMASDKMPKDHAYQRKATWILLELEHRYGDDFMARFMALRSRRYGVRQKIGLQQTFELMAETAGDPKIWEWFRKCGVSAKPATSGEQEP